MFPDYDLVALDPRGTGSSGQLTCPTSNVLKTPLVPPVKRDEFSALQANQKILWAKCSTDPGELKSHLDAFSDAKDAETLRIALGMKKINLYALSWGTLTAERYLGLFGEHVNGSLLEGVMNPALTRRAFITTAAASSEAVHDRFLRWCTTDTSCALHGTNVANVLKRAQKNAAAGRIPGSMFGRPWSPAAVTQYVQTASGNNQFAQAAKGLNDLSRGQNPTQDGADPSADDELPQRFPYADPIVCSSFNLGVKSAQDAHDDLVTTEKAAPSIGYSTNATAYTALCVGAAAPAPGSDTPATSRSAHPVMLISNTLDPATPMAWADAVARQFGAKTLHVVTHGIGHGNALENPEIRRRAIAYMSRANAK
nr:alpha/beta fold hydrolase [Streptomyces sp. SID5785]